MIQPKKILLLGDSNFRGEWRDDQGKPQWNAFWGDKVKHLDKYNTKPKKDYYVAHPGIEHFMGLDGHMVLNCSAGGASNFRSLRILYNNFFTGTGTWDFTFTAPDVIIICLTEPLRELYRFIPNLPYDDPLGVFSNIITDITKNSKTPEILNTNLMKKYLEILQHIYDVIKIPIILVEGWGRTYSLLKKYDFCHHLEERWIENIIGIKPPLITTMQTYEAVVDHFGKSLDVGRRNKLLQHYERFHKALVQKRIFHDHGHPTRDHHRELWKKLRPIVNKIPKYKLPEIDYKAYKKYYNDII